MSTRKRLEEATAELLVPLTPSSSPSIAKQVATGLPPKTGPGQMLALRGSMLQNEAELLDLRQRLKQHEGSLPTRKLDPRSIVASRWANRHPTSFNSPQFARLKSDIEHAGGNVQAIVVRPLPGEAEQYEIVFGHRRHRACLELSIPVLASIWMERVSDEQLFAAMDRENRERDDLSPYEQGVMYQRALDDGLYSSQRRLAEALGVSHTWVQKAIGVAQLPQLVVDCFTTPLDITFRHAAEVTAVLERDRRGVLKRAEKARGQGLSADAIVRQLCGERTQNDAPIRLTVNGKTLGQLTVGKAGVVTMKLSAGAIKTDRLEHLTNLLERFLSESAGEQ